MNTAEIPGFEQLTGPEKILLAEEIWNSIASDENNVPVPESHLQELRRRVVRHRSAPGQLLSLGELQQRIQARK